MDDLNLVEVGNFGKRHEAEFVKSALEENGIEAVLKGEEFLEYYEGGVSDYKIFVNSTDALKAKNIIESIINPEKGFSSLSPDYPVQNRNKNLSILFWGVISLMVGFFAGLFFGDKIKLVREYTYKSLDVNGDGRADKFYYYKNGNLISESYDRNFDGRVDEVIYYSNGYSEGWIEKDSNFNNNNETLIKFINGNLFECYVDVDEDGNYDQTLIYKNGILIKEEIKANNGKLKSIIEFSNLGIRKKEIIDDDLDGEFDREIYYDQFGNFSSFKKIK